MYSLISYVLLSDTTDAWPCIINSSLPFTAWTLSSGEQYRKSEIENNIQDYMCMKQQDAQNSCD